MMMKMMMMKKMFKWILTNSNMRIKVGERASKTFNRINRPTNQKVMKKKNKAKTV